MLTVLAVISITCGPLVSSAQGSMTPINVRTGESTVVQTPHLTRVAVTVMPPAGAVGVCAATGTQGAAKAAISAMESVLRLSIVGASYSPSTALKRPIRKN